MVYFCKSSKAKIIVLYIYFVFKYLSSNKHICTLKKSNIACLPAGIINTTHRDTYWKLKMLFPTVRIKFTLWRVENDKLGWSLTFFLSFGPELAPARRLETWVTIVGMAACTTADTACWTRMGSDSSSSIPHCWASVYPTVVVAGHLYFISLLGTCFTCPFG